MGNKIDELSSKARSPADYGQRYISYLSGLLSGLGFASIEYANSHGGISVGLLGFDGGRMKEMCHYCIHVKTMEGEYAPVEDIHLVLGHLITTYLKFSVTPGRCSS